jgi:hypothetical protein
VLARQGPGDNSLSIARLSADLGHVHLLRGNPVAAEALLREAYGIQQRTMAADSWRLAATRSTLGGALIALGRHDEAERLLIEARAVLKDVPGRQGREAAATRERLAALSAARRHAQ